jgi:hypothetical protein
MRKLIKAGNNELNVIQSTDRITADSILIKAKRAAADLKKRTGMEEKTKLRVALKPRLRLMTVATPSKQLSAPKKAPPKPLLPSLGPPSWTTC